MWRATIRNTVTHRDAVCDTGLWSPPPLPPFPPRDAATQAMHVAIVVPTTYDSRIAQNLEGALRLVGLSCHRRPWERLITCDSNTSTQPTNYVQRHSMQWSTGLNRKQAQSTANLPLRRTSNVVSPLHGHVVHIRPCTSCTFMYVNMSHKKFGYGPSACMQQQATPPFAVPSTHG